MSLFDGLEHIVTEEEPLAAHTWFRLGGPAAFFVEPTSAEELSLLVKRCRETETPVRLLGGGSNVLVPDEGFAGVVVRLSAPAFSEIAVSGGEIRSGGGAKWAHVVSTSVREGLAGLAPLVGIPGTVGGALHGNAGSHGADVGQWVAAATVMTRSGEIITRKRAEMNFAYRRSSLDELVILEARFELEPGDPRELTKKMQKQWIVRRANEPPGEQSMGCVFCDHGGVSAAEVIEQAGLKGASAGRAEVSDRNANFIVAHPGATAADVRQLIELIREQVNMRLGIELETQIDEW